MSTPIKVAIGVCITLIGMLAFQQLRTVSLERQLAAATLAPRKEAVAAAQTRVDTVTVRLQASERTVTKILERVRVDTFVVHPLTIEDTARAVMQLPGAVAQLDSVKRTCSAFVLDCAAYREATERRDSAQLDLIAGLESSLLGARPSRAGAVWNRVKWPLAFGVGLYAGSRLRR